LVVERLLIAAGLVVVAGIVAFILDRRRPDPPTQDRLEVPTQLDRADFARPEAPWLVAVFTSATCASCEGAMAKARLLESPAVAYDAIPWQTQKGVHDRYHIDTVPLTVVADFEGVVRASFVGDPVFADLAGAVAEMREPGSIVNQHPE
jgi:hypothetical protein